MRSWGEIDTARPTHRQATEPSGQSGSNFTGAAGRAVINQKSGVAPFLDQHAKGYLHLFKKEYPYHE
jgi:hypothetical protein